MLPLQPHLPNGDYSVSWRVFSDDGHLESGVLAFRVGAAAAGAGAPRPVLAAASTRPGCLDVLARWLLLGGILIAGGTALFFLLVSRAAVRRTATTMACRAARRRARRCLARPRRRRRGDALRAGHEGHGDRRARRRPARSARARQAEAGRTGPRRSRWRCSLAPTFAGHAYRAWDGRPISIAADLVHVVAAAFWTGGILQLALLLRGGQDERAVRRFSLFALPAVVLIAGSGLARALVELTAVSQLWSTAYGRAIVAKTVLFARAHRAGLDEPPGARRSCPPAPHRPGRARPARARRRGGRRAHVPSPRPRRRARLRRRSSARLRLRRRRRPGRSSSPARRRSSRSGSRCARARRSG